MIHQLTALPPLAAQGAVLRGTQPQRVRKLVSTAFTQLLRNPRR